MKHLKKIVSALIILSMIIAIVPFQVSATELVARVGDTTYTTLQSAFDNADFNTVVVLLNNIDFGQITTGKASITIESYKTVTLDLNGKEIKGEYYNGQIIVVSEGAELTIIDSSEEKTGKITALSYESGTANAIQIDNSSNEESEKTTLIINGGTIQGYTSAINVRSGSNFVLNGGTIKSEPGIENPAVTFDGSGLVTINGGTVIGTTYAVSGPRSADYSLTINGGNLISTSSSGDFAAVKITNYAAVAITGGMLTGSYAWRDETTSASDNSITISGGTFVGTKGLVCYKNINKNCPVTLYGGTFNHNPETILNMTIDDGYEVTNPNDYYTVKRDCSSHIYDYTKPTWKWVIIQGEPAAFVSYKCSNCNETSAPVRANVSGPVESEGKLTYTATDSEHAECPASVKVIESEFTVKHNGVAEPATYKWGDICTLTSSDGISKWTINGETVADGVDSYTFAVTGNVDIISAVTGAAAAPTPVIMVTITSTEAGKAVINAKWTIPGENITVESVKIYRGYTIAEKIIDSNTLKTNGKVFDSELCVQYGDYTLKLDGLTSGTYQHAYVEINYKIGESETTLTVESAAKYVHIV